MTQGAGRLVVCCTNCLVALFLVTYYSPGIIIIIMLKCAPRGACGSVLETTERKKNKTKDAHDGVFKTVLAMNCIARCGGMLKQDFGHYKYYLHIFFLSLKMQSGQHGTISARDT